MAKPAFPGLEPVRFVGAESRAPLGYRYYDKDRIVRGKRMEDQLRLAVCYWHTLCGDGSDVFGGGTFNRSWQHGDSPVALARDKASAAFELFEKLGVRYFCFHDRDVAPETGDLAETNAILDGIVEVLAGHMQRTGVKLLWERPISSATPATWPERRPIPIRPSSRTPRRR